MMRGFPDTGHLGNNLVSPLNFLFRGIFSGQIVLANAFSTTIFESTIRRMPRPQEVARMTTEELRESFILPVIHQPGSLHGLFTDLDRLVVAGACPGKTPLELPNHRETGRGSFLERRELGAINTGGPGVVTVDGKTFPVAPLGCIYIGMGAQNITFSSADPEKPARFFILSCPAHATFPTTVATIEEATIVALGAQAPPTSA
jgi:4-deoxy-L-threo-5-hexosulose-uronate ketol-isomerase